MELGKNVNFQEDVCIRSDKKKKNDSELIYKINHIYAYSKACWFWYSNLSTPTCSALGEPSPFLNMSTVYYCTDKKRHGDPHEILFASCYCMFQRSVDLSTFLLMLLLFKYCKSTHVCSALYYCSCIVLERTQLYPKPTDGSMSLRKDLERILGFTHTL